MYINCFHQIALLLWACSLAVNIHAQQVEALSALERNNILIGDQIKLNLQITHKSDIKIQKIDLSVLDTMKAIEVVSTEPIVATSTGIAQALTITSFDSGYHFIPKIPIIFLQNGKLDTVTTNELALTVNTIPQDTILIAPIKSIIEEPVGIEDFFWIAIAILALGLITLAILYFIKRKPAEKEIVTTTSTVIVPPHELALQQLKALEHRQLWQTGEVKAYHSELTRIIRVYLENRYSIQALEMTTEQILTQLNKLDFDADWNERLREMLQAADLVKFAKAEPPSEFHERMMTYAVSFVEATKKVTEIEKNVE
jgi:hypothetical protein